MRPLYYPLGDRGVKIDYGNEISVAINTRVRLLAEAVQQLGIPGVLETVVAWASVAVYFDPMVTTYARVLEAVRDVEAKLDSTPADTSVSRVIEIPVAYGGVYGPDLSFVAHYHGLTEEEVVRIHTAEDYLVYQLGFSPGFPYIKVPEPLVTPKRSDPRLRVEAGSVWIGDRVGGIYTVDTPGGTQLIGRTPVRLYDPTWDPPVLLRPGDLLRFIPIDEGEFERIKKQVDEGVFKVAIRQVERGGRDDRR